MTFFAQADEEPKRHVALGDNAPDADIPEGSPLWIVALVAALVAVWVLVSPVLSLVIVGLIIMIFLHELGHFMTARWTGMKATQFFLGFGPTLWSFKRGEVTYGLKAIPAGAFVRIIGMNNLDPVEDPADADRAYMNKSYPRRMLVITAGSLMHFLQAIVLFTVAYSIVGVQVVDPDESFTVGAVVGAEPGDAEAGVEPSPAALAGIEVGDRIVSVDGVAIATWGELIDAVSPRAGDTVAIGVERDDAPVSVVDVTLIERERPDGTTSGFFGIGPEPQTVRGGPWVGAETFVRAVPLTLEGLGQAFSPSGIFALFEALGNGPGAVDAASEEAQRPISIVGAASVTAQSAEFGWARPLEILAGINIAVGIINLVPLLPLDGGHAAIATYERLRSRRGRRHQVDVAKLLPVAYATISLLAVIGVLSIYLDISQPIQL